MSSTLLNIQHLDGPIVGAEPSPAELPSSPVCSNDITLSFMREHRVYPYFEGEDGLLVAMCDVSDSYAIHAIELATGHRVIGRAVSSETIESALARWTRSQDQERDVQAEVPRSDATIEEDVEHLKDLALETPVVQMVNDLLLDAIYARATDIHIEPFEYELAIRLRVDGLLRTVTAPPLNMAKAIISRLKILSGLDIAERRLPQDGRTKLKISGRQIDLRVATMPTIHGEAMAIRLLDNARRVLDLGQLGFSANSRDALTKQLSLPYGMILVTGPTGSGKTTTLATALSMLNDRRRKILTIEDPIEYELDGVNQTQVKPAIGLTFANALRAFLRHDPDVIMVGEMRDTETASIGVHAALTGHLVLTTLHTNSAPSAITRLLDMGIDGFLLASSLRCIVGQRLVRKICKFCRRPDSDLAEHDPDAARGLSEIGVDPHRPHWTAPGCDKCMGTGYADRVAITEVLLLDANVRNLIKPGVAPDDLDRAAADAGMKTMWQDGLMKCLDGLTTIQEVRRVAFAGQ
ncbi:MAG: GspE/PulE family protein [Hyphomicrobiaceae bacterium]